MDGGRQEPEVTRGQGARRGTGARGAPNGQGGDRSQRYHADRAHILEDAGAPQGWGHLPQEGERVAPQDDMRVKAEVGRRRGESKCSGGQQVAAASPGASGSPRRWKQELQGLCPPPSSGMDPR